MKPPNFKYVSPYSLEEILEIIYQEQEECKILSGGQSLIAMLNMRLIYPSILLDIKHINSLNNIVNNDSGLIIEANVTQQELLESDYLLKANPLLNKVLPWVGHYQTRSKGTVCGSIAHSDPSSELPLCLNMLDGSVNLVSKKERRTVKAKDFQVGMLSTLCKPYEIIESVFFPFDKEIQKVAFSEFSFRKGDFSIVSVGIIRKKDKIIIGVTGLQETPYVEDIPILQKDEIEDYLYDLSNKFIGFDDHISSFNYKRVLFRNIAKKTIYEVIDA